MVAASITALADDRTLVERILNHIDHKTTDMSDGVWHEPAAHYTSKDRLDAEITKVLRCTPTPFCPSAALPEVGSYVAREAALTPIVAMRGSDGVVRAFRNACRHRGVQLVDGAGCKKALTCRYHAWTYGLDGALRGVPDEHGFPGLDRKAYGLVPVGTIERNGLVFVTQDEANASEFEPDLVPDLFGPEWRLFSTTVTEFAANWKVLAEGMLEGYHIRSTHHDTFYPRQYDNINVIESFGRNSRISFPFRTIEKLRNVPAAERRIGGTLTHVYYLFPNVSIATFPNNRTLTALEPLGVDRTRFVTYTLTDRADSDADKAAVQKARDFVAAGTAEDREMAYAIQRGFAAGANEVFTYGLFEGAIAKFHRNLACAIEGA
jgi:phenylpropionate dioxygenase-like ring-hydroxylating dioxygenase large terminal subunit